MFVLGQCSSDFFAIPLQCQITENPTVFITQDYKIVVFHVESTLTESPLTAVVISNCMMLMFVEDMKLHIILLPNTPNKIFLIESNFLVNRQNDKLNDRHTTEHNTFPQTTCADDKTQEMRSLLSDYLE